MEQEKVKKIAFRVSIVTIAVNFLLSAFKLCAGFIGQSAAMISDAVHSVSDVISTVIVIIGIAVSSKPDDNAHPYGHERLECVASVILAVLLFGTGGVIGYNGVASLISGAYKSIPKPQLIALIAAILSIVVKEAMFWYTYVNAKKISSLSLKADAWHHRSDALSSIGSLIGIGGAMIFNLPVLDVVASLIICVFIIKVSIDVFIEAVNKMVDKSCSEEKIREIKNVLLSVEGVLSIDKLKTRMFGNKIYVDAEIGAYKNLTLEAAHKIAEAAHDQLEASDENIKHCMIHVNPVDIDELIEEVDDSIEDEISED